MSSNTIFLILLAAIIALMMAFFQYFYKTGDRSKTNIILTALRFLSTFSLFVLLINPKITTKIIENFRPILNVLVDNSKSIAYVKSEEKVRSLVDLVKDNKELNDKFDINFYSFSNSLVQSDTFSFNVSETNIIKPLQELEGLHKSDIAPTILITDGNQTHGVNYSYFKSKQPVYSIVVGDTLKYEDLKVSQVNVNSYANLKNNFPVEIFIQYEGLEDVSRAFKVYQNGKVVFNKILKFSNEKLSQKVQFNLAANSVGVQNYTCIIENLNDEKNTINNRKNFSIEVVNEQAKILILSAVNHPDISMIKRSISSNKQHKVDVINNLNSNIQYKDYQLIVLYQPNSSFKKVFEDIEVVKANTFIITGAATNWRLLNKAQPFFTKNYVSKIEDFAPILNENYDEFIVNDFEFSNLPPLKGYFGEIKFNVPNKTILYQRISNFETKNPLLTTFTLDDRRGAILLGSDIWKWRMENHVVDNSFKQFDNFFNKLIQYLSSTRKYDRLELEYESFNYANRDVVIKAQYFDATYVFDAKANLTLTLNNKGTNETLNRQFTLKNNYYSVIFSDLESGDYSFSVQNEDKSVIKYGNFTVLSFDVEQQLVTANTESLKLLSNSSRGQDLHVDDSHKMLDNLLGDKRYKTIQKSKIETQSIIDWKWLLGLTLLCFSLEWFLRKFYGKI